MRIAILGNGGFGTAMALTLERAGHSVCLWGHDADYTSSIAASRENPRYLSGVRLPAAIDVTSDGAAALSGAEVVLVAVPTQHVRAVMSGLVDRLGTDAPVVSLAKGLEQSTGKRPAQILADALGAPDRVFVLSGPSHAEEIAHGQPTTVVVAGSGEQRDGDDHRHDREVLRDRDAEHRAPVRRAQLAVVDQHLGRRRRARHA